MDVVIGSVADGRTLNRYAYVNGNPISYIDPFGLSADEDRPVWLNAIHRGLDVLAFIPGIGELFDVANGAIYLFEGDYTNAGLSLTSLIPLIGDGLVKVGKYTYKGIKYGAEAVDKTGDVIKYADEIVDIGSDLWKKGI